MRILTLILLLASFPLAGWGASIQVERIRLWAAPDSTRVVFDITGPVEHRLFTLEQPDRIVIDLSDSRAVSTLATPDFSQGLVRDIRSALHGGKDLRVVLDLRERCKPRSFLLKPNDKYGYRLVIDLDRYDDRGRQPVKRVAARNDALREVVIAIDAGHGGEDPGAIGPRGVREKDVVLGIARRLARLVEKERGMRPVLIRSGDYYVGLRKRTELARRHRADMLISLHADSFPDRRARGASVYTLSLRGASSETARWLAEKENAADLVGGVSLADKDDLVQAVLLDLYMAGTIEASQDLAVRVLRNLKRVVHLHKGTPGRAGFVVLKSPDIPSILVETAFISNPREEKKLRDPRHQQRLAEMILGGIRSYFRDNAPPGTLLAGRRHVIARGDTLSEIAQRYRVSLSRLKSANNLRNDRLRVGQVLWIPSTGDG